MTQRPFVNVNDIELTIRNGVTEWMWPWSNIQHFGKAGSYYYGAARSRRTGQTQITTRSDLEQLSNALLEPLFPVAKGIRLLEISLSALAEEAERVPNSRCPFRPIGSTRTDCVIGSAIGWARGQPGSKLGNHDVVH